VDVVNASIEGVLSVWAQSYPNPPVIDFDMTGMVGHAEVTGLSVTTSAGSDDYSFIINIDITVGGGWPAGTWSGSTAVVLSNFNSNSPYPYNVSIKTA
jgi:hypothetical protein